MQLFPLDYAILLLALNSYPVQALDEKPKQVIRSYLATECVKKVCLMKMRPYERITAKDGSITWRRVKEPVKKIQ